MSINKIALIKTLLFFLYMAIAVVFAIAGLMYIPYFSQILWGLVAVMVVYLIYDWNVLLQKIEEEK